MRKLNNIVIDSVPPEDPEVLWINPKASTTSSLGIFICEAGIWKDLTQLLGNRVSSHQTTINALPDTYASKDIEETVSSNTSAIESLEDRVSNLEPEEDSSNLED
jgi:hypothetical protein